MSELEQLKADLAAIVKTSKLLNLNKQIVSSDLVKLSHAIEAKIKKLEAPPDPFRRAKHQTEIQRKERNHDFFLADYAIHLEDEVERLKAELANAATIESELLESKSKLEAELASRPGSWILVHSDDLKAVAREMMEEV